MLPSSYRNAIGRNPAVGSRDVSFSSFVKLTRVFDRKMEKMFSISLRKHWEKENEKSLVL